MSMFISQNAAQGFGKTHPTACRQIGHQLPGACQHAAAVAVGAELVVGAMIDTPAQLLYRNSSKHVTKESILNDFLCGWRWYLKRNVKIAKNGLTAYLGMRIAACFS